MCACALPEVQRHTAPLWLHNAFFFYRGKLDSHGSVRPEAGDLSGFAVFTEY